VLRHTSGCWGADAELLAPLLAGVDPALAAMAQSLCHHALQHMPASILKNPPPLGATMTAVAATVAGSTAERVTQAAARDTAREVTAARDAREATAAARDAARDARAVSSFYPLLN
jgi:hypothetical protein